MNKLTKYGLTALAGSLVATSVSAGELGVSGSWSWSYDSADSDESGNPMSMGDSVTFSGSGETDQGWTAGVSYELDGGTYDDYKLTLDMGDSGKLTFSGASVTGDGIHMVNDIVPAADTPVMSMTDSATAYGVADGADAAGNLGYNISIGDVKLSAEMQKGAGTDKTFGVQYTGIENMTLVAGMGEVNPGQTSTAPIFSVNGSSAIAWALNSKGAPSSMNMSSFNQPKGLTLVAMFNPRWRLDAAVENRCIDIPSCTYNKSDATCAHDNIVAAVQQRE